MTAAGEETNNAQAIVASIAQKVEQGSITNKDINELRTVLNENPEAIPRLNRSFLNDTTTAGTCNVVVKCVGMVHDMLEMEYYLTDIGGVPTRFRDALVPSHELDAPHNNLAERQPLVVVPVPFSSQWTRESYCPTTNTTTTHAVNANADSSHSMMMEEDSTTLQNKRQAHDIRGEEDPPTKRKALSSSTTTPDTSVDSLMDSTTEDTTRNATHTSLDWWPPGCFHSDANSCPVLAKMYYDQDEGDSSQRLKLNDVVELVGVVSLDPRDADFSHQEESNDFEFATTLMPPPSLLPRLHVLCYKQVNLENVTDKKESTDDRSFCIQTLAQHVFGGNETAAEALLMACMSMAERHELVSEDTQTVWAPIQTPSDTTLGCASLNFILSSQEACHNMAKRLEQVLTQILPVVGLVTLHRESLGTTVVSPAKDEHTGRLVPSPLQLPKGSALVIDESMLTQGPIEARAEETLRALHSLTQRHVVPYRFEGHMHFNFEADYRVLVVSKSTTTTTTTTTTGSKLLPCLLTMKLSDEIVMKEAPAAQELSREDCTRIRSYLQTCRCNPSGEVMNVALSKNLLEQAQHDFIDKRAEYRKKKELQTRMATVENAQLGEPLGELVDEADFHRWLTLARLEARSRIPGGLSNENTERQVWADTLRLDEAMRL